MDKVFTEGIVKDPYYAAKRENTLLISIGCNVAFEDCFCTMVGGAPYNFDTAT
jgi:sulfhydrogenase subunit beta (sulfur reductase)